METVRLRVSLKARPFMCIDINSIEPYFCGFKVCHARYHLWYSTKLVKMLLLGFNESIHFPWQRDVLRCRRCIELPSGGHESCLQGKQPFPLLPGGSHPPTTFPPTSIYSTYPPPPPPMGLTHRPLPLKTSSTVQPASFIPNPQPLHFQPQGGSCIQAQRLWLKKTFGLF